MNVGGPLFLGLIFMVISLALAVCKNKIKFSISVYRQKI